MLKNSFGSFLNVKRVLRFIYLIVFFVKFKI